MRIYDSDILTVKMKLLELCVYLVFVNTRLGFAADIKLQELAQGKPTRQSGTKPYWVNGRMYDGDSSLAVDGNLSSGDTQTCSRTESVTRPWWRVDLQEMYLIHEVAITTRPTDNALREFTIEISRYEDGSGNMVDPRLCYTSNADLLMGRRYVFPCLSPFMGRYVRLTKYRDGMRTTLSHCELQVYGFETVRLFTVNPRTGRRSESPLLDTIPTRSSMLCFARCQNNPQCTSFNTAHDSPVCELVADPVNNIDENEAPASEWTRYVIL